jgi:LysR family glycine cleavage system transcriptional activator
LVASELASGALVKISNVTMTGCAFYVVHRASHPKMASIKAFVAWAIEVR